MYLCAYVWCLCVYASTARPTRALPAGCAAARTYAHYGVCGAGGKAAPQIKMCVCVLGMFVLCVKV